MLSTFWSTGARRSQRKTLNTGFLLSDNYFFGSNHSRRHSNVLIIGSWLLACVEQTLRTSLASARFFSVHVSYSMPQLHNWWKVCRPQPHPTPSILALRLSFNVYSSSVDEVVRILRVSQRCSFCIQASNSSASHTPQKNMLQCSSYLNQGTTANKDQKSPLHLFWSIHRAFLLFLLQMVVFQLNYKKQKVLSYTALEK